MTASQMSLTFAALHPDLTGIAGTEIYSETGGVGYKTPAAIEPLCFSAHAKLDGNYRVTAKPEIAVANPGKSGKSLCGFPGEHHWGKVMSGLDLPPFAPRRPHPAWSLTTSAESAAKSETPNGK